MIDATKHEHDDDREPHDLAALSDDLGRTLGQEAPDDDTLSPARLKASMVAVTTMSDRFFLRSIGMHAGEHKPRKQRPAKRTKPA